MKSTKRSTPEKARILVVDDHPLFRQGLIQLLKRQSDLVCCGEAGTAEAARAAAAKLNPDVIVLDLRLGHSDGLELLKTLKSASPAVRVLVLSHHDEKTFAERALHAGALGYLMKEEVTEEILTAIRAVFRGEYYVSRRITALVLGKLSKGSPRTGGAGIESLTDRELHVFQLLGAGLSTREIAGQLVLSIKTVETHRENIKHRLRLRNAQELVDAATAWAQARTPDSAAPPGAPHS